MSNIRDILSSYVFRLKMSRKFTMSLLVFSSIFLSQLKDESNFSKKLFIIYKQWETQEFVSSSVFKFTAYSVYASKTA